MSQRHNGSYIHEALIAEGFTQISTSPADYAYSGHIKAGGREIACEIWVNDTDFLTLPKLKILDPALKEHSVAHFEESGFYCYTNLENQVIDKYNPRGAIRTILNMMKDAISEHFRTNIETDTADEFLHHWFPHLTYFSEFQYEGNRVGTIRSVAIAKEDHVIIVDHDAESTCFGKLRARSRREPRIEIPIIKYDGELAFPKGHAQPENLFSCHNWLSALDTDLASQVLQSFIVTGTRQRLTVIIEARNISVGIEITPTEPLKRVVRSRISRQIVQTMGKTILTQRISLTVGSYDDMFGRNLGEDVMSLKDKKIALIGCGTIGSHLAKMTVQSGGGIGDGRLVLIDNEILTVQNLGRHFLGQNSLEQNKAIALENELKRLFPIATIKGRDADALQILNQLKSFDLVVDATGEEPLSVLINEWLLESQNSNPNLSGLFVWLFGNAEAAQAILVNAGDGACYRCLKPRHGDTWRYEPRRNPDNVNTEVGLCGNGSFIPYGVGGSAIAAGLASSLMLDWANNECSPRLRTIRIDKSQTKITKDVNPSPHKKSKACDRAKEHG